MQETLDLLPEEGKIEKIERIKVRKECDICGEPAHYKFTWLLNGMRSNPASSAFGKDDCSWCEDACNFSCRKCYNKVHPPNGYTECSIFPATERFAHLFLYWDIVNIEK